MSEELERELDTLADDMAEKVAEIGELHKQRSKLLNGLSIALDTMASGSKMYDEAREKVHRIWQDGLKAINE